MTELRQPITLFGFLAGLLSGLLIAVVIALYLTHAPVPFVSKVQPATESVMPDSTDPNHTLFSPQIPAAQPGENAAPRAPGDATPAPVPAPGPATTNGGEGASKAGGEAAAKSEPAGEGGTPDLAARVVLQVGAFQNPEDADAMRARLALLGLDAKVTALLSDDGKKLFRVRLGPYGQLDDWNGIRRTLSENGMEPQIVHIH